MSTVEFTRVRLMSYDSRAGVALEDGAIELLDDGSLLFSGDGTNEGMRLKIGRIRMASVSLVT